jgi:hypothetical protein
MVLGSGIRDPGSGKNLFQIPDPGSRGQKGTGSRIPDLDPQHWLPLSFSVGFLLSGPIEPDDSLSVLYGALVIINPNLPLLFSVGTLLPGPTEPGAGLSAENGGLPGAPVLSHLPGGGISLFQR